jgi:hypothetical protein
VRTFALVLILGVLPGAVRAQTAATSFDELRLRLKRGQTVVVTATSGERIKGKVGDVSGSPPSLAMLTPTPRTLAEGSVVEIRTTDSLWTGALVGGGIGAGLALWDYLIDPSEPDNGAIFVGAIAIGTAIGAGIDALIDGRRILYRSGPQKRSVTIAPIGARDRKGVQVSVRF